MKFLHAMIRVHDLDASKKFYTELLGLKFVKQKRLEDCDLYFFEDEITGAQIELTQNDDTPQGGYTNGTAFGHFAFATESMTEFDKRLKALGYKYLYEPYKLAAVSSTIAFVRDPDGNEIEIIEKSKPSRT